MAPPAVCCLTGVCCARPKQQEAIGRKIKDDLGEGTLTPDQIAAWILDNFDVWPAGGLHSLQVEIRQMISGSVLGQPKEHL